MIISDSNKLIFIHIPKTAGSSVAKAIGQSLPDCQFGGMGKQYDTHATARQLRSYPNFDQYVRFAFVRNPWDRLYSWYTFLCQGNTVAKHLRNKCKVLGFKRWLLEDRHILQGTFLPDEQKVGGQVRSQLDWILDEDDNPLVDFIGHYETFTEDFGKIQRAYNIGPLPSQPLRKSNRGDYRDAYDEEMKEFVALHFARDIKYFGYKFDE